jgi:hypothetical protein
MPGRYHALRRYCVLPNRHNLQRVYRDLRSDHYIVPSNHVPGWNDMLPDSYVTGREMLHPWHDLL